MVLLTALLHLNLEDCLVVGTLYLVDVVHHPLSIRAGIEPVAYGLRQRVDVASVVNLGHHPAAVCRVPGIVLLVVLPELCHDIAAALILPLHPCGTGILLAEGCPDGFGGSELVLVVIACRECEHTCHT